MRRISLLAGLIALAASSVQFASTAVTARSLSAPTTAERPNIIVVMTDDQDVASLKHMPHVQELIADKGATFSSHTVVFPLCCPSRSAYLSGQVGHNNHIRGNGGAEGGYSNLNHEETYPVWLSDAGYVTNHLGKFPNGYDGSQHLNSLGVPPGWTEWHGAVDPSTYVFYGYTLERERDQHPARSSRTTTIRPTHSPTSRSITSNGGRKGTSRSSSTSRTSRRTGSSSREPAAGAPTSTRVTSKAGPVSRRSEPRRYRLRATSAHSRA